MKRIVMLSFMFFFILAATQLMGQEKVKVTEDKTKIKGDDAKLKDKDDKTKTKTGNYKEKTKDDKTKIKDGDMKVKIKNPDGMNSTMDYPYTATYSSKFVMGNPAHGRMVLDLWKDWDDNAFDRHDYMADTLTMYLPDGMVVKGKAANLEGAKKYRGGMTSAKSIIHAWIPLRSTDKNEDWVAIWGTEVDTWPDGKVETRELHEIWQINKDGKIAVMRQFTAKPSQPTQ